MLYRPSLLEKIPEGNVYSLPKTSDEIVDRILDLNSDKL
jgi:hypothetical protein